MANQKSIPLVQTQDRTINQLQQGISQAVNPFIQNPANNSVIIKSHSLVVGSNTINTGLNQTLTGWEIIRQRAKAIIWDDQDNNPNPTLTLILVSDTAVSIDLLVF